MATKGRFTMSRTVFTAEDVNNIVKLLFNGNLEQVLESNNTVDYLNDNSEEITLKNIDTGEVQTTDLAKYLNIKFYTWKQRLLEKQDTLDADLTMYEAWLESMNYSLNEAYALVEVLNDDATPSQDIDNAVKEGKISFIIQTNKIKNLDYYVNKLRNKYMGVPITMQNSFGSKIKAYLMLGILNYDEEPTTLQFGECILASCGFRIAYMTDADTYSDNQIFFSFDGDDEYDENGNILGETKFLSVPLSKVSWQDMFLTNPIPRQTRPDIVGVVASSVSSVKTFSFYDFNETLIKKVNEIFWSTTAYRINGKLTTRKDINIPVYVKVVHNGNSYVFEDVIEEIQKVITNSDFNITSLTLKNWGKVKNTNT